MSEAVHASASLLLRASAHLFFSRVFLQEPAELIGTVSDLEAWEAAGLVAPGATAAWHNCLTTCDVASLRWNTTLCLRHRWGGIFTRYESCYRDPDFPGPLMGPAAVAVSGVLCSGGLEIDPAGSETPDHTGLEFLFAAHLLEQAAASYDQQTATLAQYRRFCSDHLHGWLSALSMNIERAATSCFYKAAAQVATAFLTREVETAA